MNSLTKICFFSLLTFSLQAEESFTKGFSRHQINLGLSGFNIKEETLLSRGAATFVEADFLYGVDSDLQLRLTPVASFISGQQTSRDPLSPLTNTIYLKEASVEKKLTSDVSLKAGVIYQKDFLPSIAGFTRSFPGVGLLIPYKIQNHLFEIRAQGAVPGSSGLATTSAELESSASLYSGAAFLKSTWTQSFKTTLSIAHFGFDKLSSTAADESMRRGNTVTGSNATTRTFVYNYQGNEVSMEADYKGERSVIGILASFIKNDSAPKKLNQGYFISLSPGIVLASSSVVRPIVEHYHVEGDAMVATYSDTTYGRTNRDGYRYGVSYENSRYRASFIYADSKLIAANPFQSADKTYFVNLNIDNVF